ncbi:membrane protein [Mucor ambiguus]|uniref:Membrane protein n=1 Tax=Mucor ambiguus TaxID=91626 RepID=A0A0C9M765_9FUNG|nr:membrane protein [Mucor ambiguus]
MKTNQNYTSVYLKSTDTEYDARNSSEPIIPPTSAKIKPANYSSATSSYSAEGDAQQIEHANSNKEEGEEDEEVKLTMMERFNVFLTYARPMFIMLFFDVGLPLAVYYILKIWLSILIALILSGIPPLLRVFYVFWKKRHIDILGCIFVFSFILSAVLSVISGDVRLTLLRDSTVTAVISFMFFVTLIPLKTRWFTIRPMIFLFSQQMMAEQPPVEWVDRQGEYHSMERMEFLWQNVSFYRRYCYILNVLWGFMLLGEFLAKVIMIESSLDIDHIILYGNIILISVMVSMTTGTLIASRFVRKRCIADGKKWHKENNYAGRLPQ